MNRPAEKPRVNEMCLRFGYTKTRQAANVQKNQKTPLESLSSVRAEQSRVKKMRGGGNSDKSSIGHNGRESGDEPRTRRKKDDVLTKPGNGKLGSATKGLVLE